jgi:hypothetical protein
MASQENVLAGRPENTTDVVTSTFDHFCLASFLGEVSRFNLTGYVGPILKSPGRETLAG